MCYEKWEIKMSLNSEDDNTVHNRRCRKRRNSGSGYRDSARENDGDFSNKKACVMKQVIRKVNATLFKLGHILLS